MSALNSSVVSATTTVGAKQFQWGLVLVEKTTSGHHYKSGPLIIHVLKNLTLNKHIFHFLERVFI